MSTEKTKIYPIFDNEIWNFFFQNMRDTWNHIVIKFLAMQLYPCLEVNGLNGLGDATTTLSGNRVKELTK